MTCWQIRVRSVTHSFEKCWDKFITILDKIFIGQMKVRRENGHPLEYSRLSPFSLESVARLADRALLFVIVLFCCFLQTSTRYGKKKNTRVQMTETIKQVWRMSVVRLRRPFNDFCYCNYLGSLSAWGQDKPDDCGCHDGFGLCRTREDKLASLRSTQLYTYPKIIIFTVAMPECHDRRPLKSHTARFFGVAIPRCDHLRKVAWSHYVSLVGTLPRYSCMQPKTALTSSTSNAGEKNDCPLFCVASHSKKRPHNLVMVWAHTRVSELFENQNPHKQEWRW